MVLPKEFDKFNLVFAFTLGYLNWWVLVHFLYRWIVLWQVMEEFLNFKCLCLDIKDIIRGSLKDFFVSCLLLLLHFVIVEELLVLLSVVKVQGIVYLIEYWEVILRCELEFLPWCIKFGGHLSSISIHICWTSHLFINHWNIVLATSIISWHYILNRIIFHRADIHHWSVNHFWVFLHGPIDHLGHILETVVSHRDDSIHFHVVNWDLLLNIGIMHGNHVLNRSGLHTGNILNWFTTRDGYILDWLSFRFRYILYRLVFF